MRTIKKMKNVAGMHLKFILNLNLFSTYSSVIYPNSSSDMPPPPNPISLCILSLSTASLPCSRNLLSSILFLYYADIFYGKTWLLLQPAAFPTSSSSSLSCIYRYASSASSPSPSPWSTQS